MKILHETFTQLSVIAMNFLTPAILTLSILISWFSVREVGAVKCLTGSLIVDCNYCGCDTKTGKIGGCTLKLCSPNQCNHLEGGDPLPPGAYCENNQMIIERKQRCSFTNCVRVLINSYQSHRTHQATCNLQNTTLATDYQKELGELCLAQRMPEEIQVIIYLF